MVEFKIDISKRALFVIILGFILLVVLGFAISQGIIPTSDNYGAPNPGHTARDVYTHVNGDIMTLQDAIDDDYVTTKTYVDAEDNILTTLINTKQNKITCPCGTCWAINEYSSGICRLRLRLCTPAGWRTVSYGINSCS